MLLPVLRRGAAELIGIPSDPADRSKERADRLELRRRLKRQTKQRKQAGSIKKDVQPAIRPSATSTTTSAHGTRAPPGPVGAYWANAGDPLAATGTRRESLHGRPDPSSAWWICARPRSHHPSGGIDIVASSCSSATSASTS